MLITSGTRLLGNAVLKRFLDSNIKEVSFFSCEEKKQGDVYHIMQNSKVKFCVEDVRDKRSVNTSMEHVDYVFYAIALKQVYSYDFFSIQAVHSNVLVT